MKKIIIMISGRGSNMEAIIKNCHSGQLQNLCQVMAVFSDKPAAAGLQIAQEMGIPTYSILARGIKRAEYNRQLAAYLQSKNPDLIVLAGYMKVLPAAIIAKFPQRIINIHPADTRLHQGLHGYRWAWEKQLPSTKITVHFVDAGLDTGQIIAQRQVELRACKSLEEVEKVGLQVEHQFYSECLAELMKKNDL
ncbi:MAG: phosphoribosylglycinamide formyltransferase [Candidatus Cloacimonadales bacterium]